jgi:AsmA protein
MPIKKILKYTGSAVGALLLLIMIAIVAIHLFFDPNTLKPQISAAVKEATGRELTISGDIGLSVFPWLGIELGATSLSNAPGFDNEPFAKIDNAEIKIKLLPLLKHEVQMKTVALNGMAINLAIAKDGTSNWQDMMQALASNESEHEPTKPASDFTLAAIAISGLTVSNAKAVYDNQQTQSRYAIENLNLSTGPVTLETPIDFNLDADLSSSKPKATANIKLASRIQMDLANHKFQLEQTQLDISFDSPELKQQGQLQIAGNIQLDTAQSHYQIKPAEISLKSNLLPGVLRLHTDLDADMQAGNASLNNLQLEIANITANGSIAVTGLNGEIHYDGQLKTTEFNPRQTMQALAIEAPKTADEKVLQSAQTELEFTGDLNNAELNRLILKLDETTLQGQASVHNFSAPALKYEINVDAIDADRYLAPKAEKSATPPPTPASAGVAAAALPLDTLRKLDIDGKANIGKLKISNLRLNDIRTTLKAKDGVIRLAPVSANLYQGNYLGETQIDARGDTPKISLKESLRGIMAGPLLKDFMGDDMINGKGSLEANLTAEGLTPADITKTLNGQLQLSFANISMKGLNIAAKAREARAKLKREAVPKTAEARPTDFSEVKATVQARNGILSNNDLSAKAPFARIAGAGTVDLVQEQLDYMVSAKIVASSAGEGGADLNALKGLTIPVRISGPLKTPKFDLQYDDMLKDKFAQEKAELKEKLDAKLQQEKAALEEKLAREKAAVQERLRQEQQQTQQKLEQKAEQKREEIKQQTQDKLKEKLKGFLNR